MLRFENVARRFGAKSVLSGVSGDFGPGLHLLTGPSGTGKTTLLRLAATVDRPTSGKIIWENRPLPAARQSLRRGLGYGPQSAEVPDDLSAMEFLTHMAALKGLGPGGRAQALHLLDRLGLARDAETRLIGWSGGMKRRLVLAQALLGAPRLLVLDEPTAELDRDTAAAVARLVTEAAGQAAVLLSTHLTEHFPGGRTLRLVEGALVS